MKYTRELTIHRIAVHLWGLLALATCGELAAISPCPVGFLAGSSVDIDGTRGTQWDDASVITSAEPCLGPLLEADLSENPVTVYTKRYERDEADFLGLFFEVVDTSSAKVSEGERVVIQLGAAASAERPLDGDDRKIELTHDWTRQGGDRLELTTVAYDGGGAGTTLCPDRKWRNLTPPGDLVAKALAVSGGYNVEVEIPLSMLGNPVGEVGVAFAVINDFADCTNNVCTGHGASYPEELPVSNGDNPLTGCQESWTAPEHWATGFFDAPPSDVYLSRLPKSWLSEDVDALNCQGDPDNNYYPANPCGLAIEGCLRNDSASDQIRNIVYLVGKRAISGREWQFVDLKTETISTGRSCFDSKITEEVADLTGHPCVRVYALPPSFEADFDRNRIESIESTDDLKEMVAAYGLGKQHWAQQNLSRQGETDSCPIADCRIKRLGTEMVKTTPRTRQGAGGGYEPGYGVSPARPPIVENPGTEISLPPEELRKFSQDHVIVQVRAFASQRPEEKTLDSQLRYDFVTEKGGVVELVPAERLAEERELEFAFLLENPSDTAETVSLRLDAQVPDGSTGVRFAMDLTPRVLEPGESTTVFGQVLQSTSADGRLSLSLHGGVNEPQGSFGSGLQGGESIGLDLEYLLNDTWAVELFLGCDTFGGRGLERDLDVCHLSFNVKAYRDLSDQVRGFSLLGVGQYSFDPGSTESGVSAGFGLQLPLQPSLAIESTAKYHSVSGGDFDFVTFQGGIRFRF